jgi:hypothetical protein
MARNERLPPAVVAEVLSGPGRGPIQSMSRQIPSAINRTSLRGVHARNGRMKVWTNNGSEARNGPTRIARTMTMTYGPIQPQDVVMS